MAYEAQQQNNFAKAQMVGILTIVEEPVSQQLITSDLNASF